MAGAPGASRDCVVIVFDTNYTKILRALLRQGWAWKENHVHKKMHILDVIRSVWPQKCTEIVGRQTPLGSLLCSLRPLAWFKRAYTSKAPTSKGRRGESAKMICAPRRQKPSRCH